MKDIDMYNGSKGIKLMTLLARYLRMRLHLSFFAIQFDDRQKTPHNELKCSIKKRQKVHI